MPQPEEELGDTTRRCEAARVAGGYLRCHERLCETKLSAVKDKRWDDEEKLGDVGTVT